MFELDRVANQGAKIKVLGVGGSGCNAVNTMIRMGLEGVEFITANTDQQALEASLAAVKIPIGSELTKGLGAGANPEVGRKAALEDYATVAEILRGADMVFITAGMGGGTGTGAAPIFAKIAKEVGALTVGVVTKPFMFEGKKRMRFACEGLDELRKNVDSLITIPNQRLLAISGSTLSMVDAFRKADEVLLNAVQGISDLINHTGLINSDFADVKTIMQNKGLALMGIGYATGEHRAVEAATNAISSPLLEDVSIDGATGIIINITGGSNLKIHEVNEATTLIMEAAHEDAEIIFGTVIDENMKDSVKVTVIATGLGGSAAPAHLSRPVPSYHAEAVTMAVSSMQSSPTLNAAAAIAASAAEQKMHAQAQAQMAQKTLNDFRNEKMHEISHHDVAQVENDANSQLLEPAPIVTSAIQSGTSSFILGNHSLEKPVEQLRPVAASISPTLPQTMAMNSESHHEEPMDELSRARSIARSLDSGGINDNEFDIPTFLRRQQEEEKGI